MAKWQDLPKDIKLIIFKMKYAKEKADHKLKFCEVIEQLEWFQSCAETIYSKFGYKDLMESYREAQETDQEFPEYLENELFEHDYETFDDFLYHNYEYVFPKNIDRHMDRNPYFWFY